MNIVLIGYRGTGKTSVACHLAELSGWPCIDTDVLVESTARMTIAEIFELEGEAGFRDRESAAILEAVKTTPCIVATGGGAILREENRRQLRANSLVVWLRANVDTIHERVQADTATTARRPNLTVAGGKAEIEQILHQRNPIYADVANVEIDTDTKSPEEIAREVWLVAGPGQAVD